MQTDEVLGGGVKLDDEERVLAVSLPLALSVVIVKIGVATSKQGVVARLEQKVAISLAHTKESGGLNAETQLLEMLHHYETLIHSAQ